MDDDDDEDDFAAAFAEFNENPALSELSERISNNLREQAGIGGSTVIHEGEGDEGRITWVAPESAGLHNAKAITNAAAEAEDSLWNDLAPDEDEGASAPSPAISENILQAKAAVETMEREEAEETAILFEKLASHGKGFAVLDIQEFQELMLKLAKDPRGAKLLRVLLGKVSSRG